MRQLLPALLLLAAVGPAWGHPMPSSAIELRLHRTRIDAVLTLPATATPDTLTALRGRATYSRSALNIRLLRTPLRAELRTSDTSSCAERADRSS